MMFKKNTGSALKKFVTSSFQLSDPHIAAEVTGRFVAVGFIFCLTATHSALPLQSGYFEKHVL